MTQEDLRFIADALVALCQKDNQAPFYSEAAFEKRLRRHERRDSLLAKVLRVRQDTLWADECRDVLANANLTARQSHVLNLRLEGFTFEEIGNACGHSKQGAQSIFLQALKKLTRAFHVYPYSGLSDVYRWEVKRGGTRGGFGTMPQ